MPDKSVKLPSFSNLLPKNLKITCTLILKKQKSLRALFQNDLEPKKIIKNLQLQFDKSITPETLLIFDEIQECESALTSLKYFNEEMPQQPIACAGSLLGIKLNHNKGFPVGKVTFLSLYPLSFLEFFNAIGKNRLSEYINNLTVNESIASTIHEQLIELLKVYFIVGGMPAVIEKYIESSDWESTRDIQFDILNAYHLDFAKHIEAADTMKVIDSWNSIPKQLAKDNKKFKYAIIQKNARAREYKIALEWLINAGLILPSYHIKDRPKFPLLAYADRHIFKIYSLDVGLLGAQSNLSPKILLEGNKLFTEFKGALTENFVAQEITVNFDKNLFYWTQDNTAEVDFILQYDNQLIPFEVKAGNNIRAKSLTKYRSLYEPNTSLKGSLQNLKKQKKHINMPLYLAGIIKQLIDSA